MPDNTCITCGRIIPEGRHICLACERENEVNSFSPKLRTNGDRIRQMTNDELVPVVMSYVCVRRGIVGCPACNCGECVKHWLESEVKHE